MITVGIVDNDPYAVAVLSKLLRDGGLQVAWGVTSAAPALRRCLFDADVPQVLVSDVQMDDMNGMELCRQIRQRRTVPGIIMITAYPPERYLDEAVKAGAQGLYLKTDMHGIRAGVRAAAAGLSAQPDAGFMDCVEARGALLRGRGAKTDLSERERTVLGMYADGKTTDDITRALAVSKATVATYEKRASAKLGAATRAQAVAKYIRLLMTGSTW
ncbi:response regulator transcription factor [Bifidobacterium sp. MA2]|uniref:Response regulator transcription factor n=1 Tax=Bifidobacterium santillanense TaxID=2809028 RepID=A0ABS5UQ56_9BIFI|nr:response regulator transcription factor [Bifidobacterium santillanense]MBT1173012.1 response regulator transcription factor [Bifidobacterium santillanense]